MCKISLEQAAFLKTVASLAYGSGIGEKELGGKGHMALLNENGKVRVIKCNTHLSHADKVQKEIRNAKQVSALRQSLLEGSKLLSQSLVEIGKSLGLSEEALKDVRACAENGGKTLLTRQMVAKFVTAAKNQESAAVHNGERQLDRIWDDAQKNAVKSDFSMTFSKVAEKNAPDFHGTIKAGNHAQNVENLRNANDALGFSRSDLFRDDEDNPVRALMEKLQSGRPQSPDDEVLLQNVLRLSAKQPQQRFNNEALNALLRDAYKELGEKPTEDELSAFRKSAALKETVVGMLRGTKTEGDLSILVKSKVCDVLSRVLQEKNITGVCKTMADTFKKNGLTTTAQTLVDLTKALETEKSIDNYNKLKAFLVKLNAAGFCNAQLAKDIGAGQAGTSISVTISKCLNNSNLSCLSSAEKSKLRNALMKAVNKEIDALLVDDKYDHTAYCKKLQDDLRTGGEKADLIFDYLRENDKEYMSTIKGFTDIDKMLKKGEQHVSQVVENDELDRKVTDRDGSVYERTDVYGGRSFGKEYEKHADQSCLFHSVLKGLGYDVSRENGLILRQALNNFISDCLAKIKGYEQGETFKNGSEVSDFIKLFKPNYDSQGAVPPGTKLAKQFTNDVAFDITSPSTMMDDGIIPFLATMLNRPIELVEVDGKNEVVYSAKFDFNVMTGEKLDTSESVVRIMHKGAHFQSLELIKAAEPRPQPVHQNDGPVKTETKMAGSEKTKQNAAPKLTVKKPATATVKNVVVDQAELQKNMAVISQKLDKIVQTSFSRENMDPFNEFKRDWTKDGPTTVHKGMSEKQKKNLADAIKKIVASLTEEIKKEFGSLKTLETLLTPRILDIYGKNAVIDNWRTSNEFREQLFRKVDFALEHTEASVITDVIKRLRKTDDNFDDDMYCEKTSGIHKIGFPALAGLCDSQVDFDKIQSDEMIMNDVARQVVRVIFFRG